MASLTQRREAGFETDPCIGSKKTFFAKKWKQRASGRGNVAGANFDKVLEVDPASCAKEAAA